MTESPCRVTSGGQFLFPRLGSVFNSLRQVPDSVTLESILTQEYQDPKILWVK